MIKFKQGSESSYEVKKHLSESANVPLIILGDSKWDDWFEFETVYKVSYLKNNKRIELGGIKIAKRYQSERRAPLSEEFDSLPEDYFSLGTSSFYYERLKELDEREEILVALKDIAFNLELFNMVASDRVTKISLLRDITPTMVRGQWHRIATGGAELTNYDFTYRLPEKDILDGQPLKLSFKVDIENKIPSSNIHVLIGKNGVGKTTILKRMIRALEGEENVGEVTTDWDENFSNIVNISFSAFDIPIFAEELGNDLVIKYTYVGLVQMKDGKKSMKSREQLADDFFQSMYRIIKGSKKHLWNKAIDVLESDNTFKELNIRNWSELDNSITSNIKLVVQKEENETDIEFRKRVDKESYKRSIKLERFEHLSSGHKNILLTMVTLIDLVEEKTLVILDEPEEHLHPPLVSAFMRALSNLLSYRNGVGIIATHSPVIVQEVPKKCVWILRKHGNYMKFERPEIETFGENLGILTSEIFGYEVMESGFHKILRDVANKGITYNEAIDEFNNELGSEAKAILKSYTYRKESK